MAKTSLLSGAAPRKLTVLELALSDQYLTQARAVYIESKKDNGKDIACKDVCVLAVATQIAEADKHAPESLIRVFVNVAKSLVQTVQGFALASSASELVTSVAPLPVLKHGLDADLVLHATSIIALTITEAVSQGHILLDTFDAYVAVAPFLLDTELFRIGHIAVSIQHVKHISEGLGCNGSVSDFTIMQVARGPEQTQDLPALDLSAYKTLRGLHVHSAHLTSWPSLPMETLETLEFFSCDFSILCAEGPWKFAARIPNLDTFVSIESGFPGSNLPKFCHDRVNAKVVRFTTKFTSVPSVVDLSSAPNVTTLESDMSVVGCAPTVKTFTARPRASERGDFETVAATVEKHLSAMADLADFALLLPPTTALSSALSVSTSLSLGSILNRIVRLDLSRAHSLPYAVATLATLPTSGAAAVRMPSALVQWKAVSWAKSGLGSDVDEGLVKIALLAKSKSVTDVCVTGVGHSSHGFTRVRDVFARYNVGFQSEFDEFCW